MDDGVLHMVCMYAEWFSMEESTRATQNTSQDRE